MLRFLPDVAVHIRDFLKVVDVTEEGTKASEYIDVLQRPIYDRHVWNPVQIFQTIHQGNLISSWIDSGRLWFEEVNKCML